ncbi:MAG: polysaccharide deacetylase family protein [bacterium]|nr:polysaccharide deacetylase family protein [bacterium]
MMYLTKRPLTIAGVLLATVLVVVAFSCAEKSVRVSARHPSGGTASAAPPGGLAVEQVPQFVHFGFDDNRISGRDAAGTTGGLKFVTDLFSGKQNPAGTGNARTYDGTPARFSFYVISHSIAEEDVDAPEHVKLQWRAAVDAGHEIGIHTHNHPHGTAFTSEQWSEEISLCRSWLTKPFDAAKAADPGIGIGVAAKELFGFRAPYLEWGKPLLPALRAQGLRYDCSIEEGVDDGYDGTNLVWPYRIEPAGDPAAGSELWEIPAYVLIVPPDDLCEHYGVPPGLRTRLAQVQSYLHPDGKISGFDWNLWVEFGMNRREVVATLKYNLDRRLAGNRAPLTFGTHSDIYSDQYYGATPGSSAADRQQALVEILEYALSKPEVRVVSAKQILDWVEDPVPL